MKVFVRTAGERQLVHFPLSLKTYARLLPRGGCLTVNRHGRTVRIAEGGGDEPIWRSSRGDWLVRALLDDLVLPPIEGDRDWDMPATLQFLGERWVLSLTLPSDVLPTDGRKGPPGKIDDFEALTIVKRISSGERICDLAEEYNVLRGTISRIKSGKRGATKSVGIGDMRYRPIDEVRRRRMNAAAKARHLAPSLETQEKLRKIIGWQREGATQRQMAGILGCTQESVCRLVRRHADWIRSNLAA